jgi:Methyltransferase domain
MPDEDLPEHRVESWLAALEERHLSNLTAPEVARALRALSSCYVERRSKLSEGGALGTAGKRAAFALFYAPLHLLLVQHIVRALEIGAGAVTAVVDLGCGTGSAGAAWALAAGNVPVAGTDRHPWAVAEANWTYRELGLKGRAVQQDLSRTRLPSRPGTGVIAAYAINELSDAGRADTLPRLLRARSAGAAVLVVEPIARRLTPWWSAWDEAFRSAGGRSDEWRLRMDLPRRQRDLARAAGLRPEELTARTLFAGGPL